MSEILILRHGQTEWNLARRFQGAMDSPLTPLGVQQAQAQARILQTHLAGLRHHRLVCSPQPRALRTAGIALEHLNTAALIDNRLCEITLGLWEGLTHEEIAATEGLDEDDVFWWMDRAPKGEGHAAVAARVAALLAEITGPAILVTHGITACHLRGHLRGLTMPEIAGLSCEQGVVYRICDGQELVLRDSETQLAIPSKPR